MPSATTSGADTGGSGGARSREHNSGNQGRTFTPDQEAAVIRIRKCKNTAFYEILAVERTCTDGEVKKAYRKLSLLTHPDKNGHPNADEAFKMVSRAFGVLSDKEKRDKFDTYGTDPDSRFESARAQNNPFAGARGGGGFPGGAARGGFGGGDPFGDQMSPEEMFARFFAGGFGGGGGGFGGGPFGGFDTGPQFVFNLGGNRGFRVHNMNGGMPRRRPRGTPGPNGQPAEGTAWDTLISLLPVLFLFLFPLLTSLFSSGDPTGSGSSAAVPNMAFDKPASMAQTLHRTTPRLNVDYYLDPQDVEGYTDYRLRQLDKEAEHGFVRGLRRSCDAELRTRQSLVDQAQGWFFVDEEKMKIARSFHMMSCDRLDQLKVSR